MFWFGLALAVEVQGEGDGVSVQRPLVEQAPVVGGEPTDAVPWPGVAMLFGPTGEVGCTGVFVAPDVVLTAGHCASTTYHVASGETPDDVIPVAERFIYPDYLTHYDAAALVLERPAAGPIADALVDCEADVLADGQEAAVVGYGSTDVEASTPGGELRVGFVSIEDSDCDDWARGCNPAVSPGGELIAGGDGVDSCRGDSGGPLYLLQDGQPVLAGLVARGAFPRDNLCGDGGIYVRVDAIWSWLEQTVSADLEASDCVGQNRAPKTGPTRLVGVAGQLVSAQVVFDDPDSPDHSFTWLGSPQDGYVTSDGLVVAWMPEAERSVSWAVRVSDGEFSTDAPLVVERLASVEPMPARGCNGAGLSYGGWWLGCWVLLARRRG